MKIRILFLSIFSLFLLCSCTKEIVTCEIISPKEGESFSKFQPIEVVVEASTTKGSIIQVQVSTGEFLHDIFTSKDTISPYNFIISNETFEPGPHYITAVAFNSNQMRETSAVLIFITE
jgi:hypothetical protein